MRILSSSNRQVVDRLIARDEARNPAVERQGGLVTRPAGVGPGILAGRAVPGQAAAGEQLVEAGQPAEAGVAVEVDELRVDRALERGAPAEALAAVVAAPQAHAARRQDGDGQGAVVDLDEVNAVAQAAA